MTVVHVPAAVARSGAIGPEVGDGVAASAGADAPDSGAVIGATGRVCSTVPSPSAGSAFPPVGLGIEALRLASE